MSEQAARLLMCRSTSPMAASFSRRCRLRAGLLVNSVIQFILVRSPTARCHIIRQWYRALADARGGFVRVAASLLNLTPSPSLKPLTDPGLVSPVGGGVVDLIDLKVVLSHKS